ncbi:hypothetical protein [Enterococcus sp. DIV0800]|uniref:hypothetical protein n=1 Tax=unclassified Enterococcus TaxID=2608891 RepID=UPI003D2FFD77
MDKKKIGWLVLGLIVIVALSFAGYRIYQDKVTQTENAHRKVLNERLTNLYEDQKTGYFKANLSETAFDDLTNEVKNQQGNSQTLTDIEHTKKDFAIQTELNGLFESDVLNGLDLSAHPILTEPEAEKIKELKNQLAQSTAKEKDWGQDMAMILGIAEKQSADYSKADNDLTNLLNKGNAISLSDYLAEVRTLAVLPDGVYKESLLKKLDPVKNQLANENSSFANEIQQSEASLAAAEKTYQEKQAKALLARNKELAELKKELAEKQATYDSYKDLQDSINDSKRAESSRKQKESEESDANDSSSESSSSTSSSNSSSSSSSSSHEENNQAENE